MPDFTLKMYRNFLITLKQEKYSFFPYSELLTANKAQRTMGKTTILRHDVDHRPSNALETAKIEKELGITGAYYFRILPESFNQNIIKQIVKLGHVIGYHYENLSSCGGDLKLAIED